MTLLLEFKEKCKQIYANYGYAILPVLKFILAIGIFYGINTTLNFSEIANNIYIILIMALICCVLPLGITVFCGIGLIVLQCYSVGIEVAGFAVVLIILLMIFYMRFTPDDAIVLLLTPLAFILKIPCVIPVGYGLVKKPASALSTACGVIVYYFIMLIQQKASVLQAISNEEISKSLQIMIDNMLNNSDLLVNMVGFVAVMLTVYLIRRLSVDYAWQISIFTGSVMYIIIWVLASLFMDVECSYPQLILGTIVSVIVIEIFAFFRYGVDYSRTEYHQFEDDDYYYYVKAVPKAKITEKNVTVKKIHTKEPEVVVEEVKVYKKKEKSGSAAGSSTGSGVAQNTIAYTPISKKTPKSEEGKHITKTVEQDMKEGTAKLAEKPADVEDVDFRKKLEESLKNL